MKKITSALFLLVLVSFAYGQTNDSLKKESDSIQVIIDKLQVSKDSVKAKADTVRNWKKGTSLALNFSQSSFTNWAAGGENALSVTVLTNFFANYKKGDWSWDNNLDLAYGLLKSGKSPFRKNEDKIDLTTKAGRKAIGWWHYSLMVNFKSQFDLGYNYPNDSVVVSHFMAPGYVVAALGMDYKKPDGTLSIMISPLTSKTTIVNNQRLADAGAYGLDGAGYDTVSGVYVMVSHAGLVRSEFGGYFKLSFKDEILKNVNYTTNLELFTNYLQNPQNIDVLWENIITFKVNKFITSSITTNLIYDHDIPVPVERNVNGVMVPGTGPRLQFKEVLAIGLAYKF